MIAKLGRGLAASGRRINGEKKQGCKKRNYFSEHGKELTLRDSSQRVKQSHAAEKKLLLAVF
jgi:hypothetical protein